MVNIEKIKEEARKKGFSLAGLEKELEIGNGTIGKWNENSPNINTIKKISDFFGVQIDDLITEKEG